MKTRLSRKLKKIWFYKLLSNIKRKLIFFISKRKVHKKGLKLLDNINTSFKNSNYMIFIAFGTLLGVIRNNNIISYDHDLDCGIMIENDFNFDNFVMFMKERGFILNYQFSIDGVISEQNYSKFGVPFDLFFYRYDKRINKYYTYVHLKDEIGFFSYKVFCPNCKLIDKKITNNYKVKIPEDYENYLIDNYGADWRIPNSKFERRRDDNEFGEVVEKRIVFQELFDKDEVRKVGW